MTACQTWRMSSIETGEQRRERLAAARVYLICSAMPNRHELPDLVREAAAGGVDIVQLRDKVLPDNELAAVANATRALCERLGILLIVNDRPAVAVEAGADGVHVGQDDLAVNQVREIVGEDLLIGLSTHSPEQIDAAAGVDYIGVGPVHETPTKPGRPAVGLDLVRHAAAHARVPFFAIGGIDPGNVEEVVAAGARRVAVVRSIADVDDPRAAAQALREAVQREPLVQTDAAG